MNKQDQQAIDELFGYLYQTTQQAGPRDSEAEALIQRYVQQAPPGLLYQMAQTLIAQQGTIRQMRGRLAAYQGPGGGSAGFAQPGYGQPAYQQASPYQQAYPQGGWQQGRGGGFLAGAGQLALGIGGGILGAEILTNIFDGGLFGDGADEYSEGYQDGFAAGDDDGGQNDGGGYDDGGDFSGGDFSGGDFGGGDFS